MRTDSTDAAGSDAFVDVDGDGDMGIYVMKRDQDNMLYRNSTKAKLV